MPEPLAVIWITSVAHHPFPGWAEGAVGLVQQWCHFFENLSPKKWVPRRFQLGNGLLNLPPQFGEVEWHLAKDSL